jgi:hypothetical protein
VRILVHVTDLGFLRHFTSVFRSLVRRGHTIRVASPAVRPGGPPPALTFGIDAAAFVPCPEFRGDALGERIGELRTLRDYLRYLERPFADATKLRARALRKVIRALSGGEHAHLAARCPHCDGELADDEVVALLSRGVFPRRLAALLALVEEALPSDAAIEAFLRAERPDVLVVTPLVRIGSHQSDYVKSAKALGIPVVFPVFSWDNLSTKGLIHEIPDRVLVWNEWQRAEAIEMHGVPAEQVVVTGAPRFDHFFAMKPKVARERFCRKRGLDPARPILTYLCSSNFVAGREREFVIRWIDEIRRVPSLAECSIVIRPHPREKAQWRKFRRPPGVAMSWPRSITGDRSLFDTIHHSAAIVGLNTSAEIEAGIAGRPVFTLTAPEFADGQQGTLHFHHLLREHGGFVEVARDFESHARQLEAALAGGSNTEAIRSAIERFVRPHGIERRATAIMADAIEAVAPARHKGPADWLTDRAWRALRVRLAVLRRHAASS